MKRRGIGDARIVQQDIYSAPLTEGSINDLLTINHRIVIRDRVTVTRCDFINHGIRAVCVAAFTGDRSTQIALTTTFAPRFANSWA